MKIRVPKPFMKFADTYTFTAYAWCCDHKTLGLMSLGDTAQEAKESFKEVVRFELASNDIVFIG